MGKNVSKRFGIFHDNTASLQWYIWASFLHSHLNNDSWERELSLERSQRLIWRLSEDWSVGFNDAAAIQGKNTSSVQCV